jgi:hypothetical protein
MFFAGRNDPHLNTMSPREGTHCPRGRSLSFPWAHTDAGSESAAAPRKKQPPSPIPVQRAAHIRPKPDLLIPQSQFLSQSYESALPTSLTYIILSTRGCSPWRPARADTSALDTARAAVLYGGSIPISRQTDFRESHTLQRKENSSQGSRRHFRVCLRYRI